MRRRKALGGVPKNFKPAPLVLSKVVEDAEIDGWRDADAAAFGDEPLNGKVYASEKAFMKAQGTDCTAEIAAAAVAAYRAGRKAYQREYGTSA